MTVEMPKLRIAIEKAKPWMKQCGNCDGGLAMNCVCPSGDPRPIISELLNAAILLEAFTSVVRPLSETDYLLRMAECDSMFGDVSGCGGTYNWSGPPCGGCIDCGRAMVSHYFEMERQEAKRYHEAGLEWAPYVIEVDHYKHSKYERCSMTQRPKEEK